MAEQLATLPQVLGEIATLEPEHISLHSEEGPDAPWFKLPHVACICSAQDLRDPLGRGIAEAALRGLCDARGWTWGVSSGRDREPRYAAEVHRTTPEPAGDRVHWHGGMADTPTLSFALAVLLALQEEARKEADDQQAFLRTQIRDFELDLKYGRDLPPAALAQLDDLRDQLAAVPPREGHSEALDTSQEDGS